MRLRPEGAKAGSAAGRRLTPLRAAALAATLLAGLHPVVPTRSMPLREAGRLAVDCRIDGLPPAEAAAAAPALCARVIAAARRGAPYAVGGALADEVVAPRLHIRGVVTGAAGARRLAIGAELVRPGQPAAPPLRGAAPAVAYGDAAAEGRAIEAALAAVLPWRARRDASPPPPPRAH